MSEKFLRCHPFVVKWEGGLDDDPVDAGGITKYGVSIEFLKDLERESASNRAEMHVLGLALPVSRTTVKELTREQAEKLFKWQFWDRLKLDRFPIRVAAVLYDAAVNCGRKASVKLMQRGCMAAGLLPPHEDDGILGPKSEDAFAHADSADTLDLAITARDNYYKEIVRRKPSQSRFINGWLNRTKDLRAFIRGL